SRYLYYGGTVVFPLRNIHYLWIGKTIIGSGGSGSRTCIRYRNVGSCCYAAIDYQSWQIAPCIFYIRTCSGRKLHGGIVVLYGCIGRYWSTKAISGTIYQSYHYSFLPFYQVIIYNTTYINNRR